MRNIGEGVFRDAREAVLFALNYRGEQYAKSTLALLAQEGRIGNGRGLHGLDGAATRASVMRKLESLHVAGQAALIARSTPCNSEGWSAAVQELERFIAESMTLPADLVALYIRKYFGESVTMQEIADRVGVTRVTVHRQALPIKQEIDRLESEAWAQFDEALRRASLVEEY